MRAFRALRVSVAATSVVVLLACATNTPPEQAAVAPLPPPPAARALENAESQTAPAAATDLPADEAAQKMRALSGDCRAEFSGVC
jgi:hypothetical protein